MKRIVVMNQMATVLVLTKRALMSAGYITHAVQSWKDAKEFLASADLFLVGWDDYEMPAEQGDNVVYAAKLEAPNVKVYLHSWEAVEDSDAVLKRLGADGIITGKGDAVALIRQVKEIV